MPNATLSITNPSPSLDQGPYAGLPVWMKASAIIGIPGALVFLLFFAFYQLTGSAAEDHRRVMTEHVAETKARDVRMDQFMTVHERHEDLVRQILQQLCVQQAKTPGDRKACIPTVGE
jgi:hypothetical protein